MLMLLDGHVQEEVLPAVLYFLVTSIIVPKKQNIWSEVIINSV